jgi:Holliday junction resolvase
MPRGIEDERNLVRLLWRKGFVAIRVTASGAATKMPRPDIIAGNGVRNIQYAIEAKTTGSKTLYLDKESIEQLLEFAKRFGCTPILAVKFKRRRKPWIFLRPSDLNLTEGKNYRLTLDEALTKGMDLKTICGEGLQMRLL